MFLGTRKKPTVSGHLASEKSGYWLLITGS